MRVLCGNTHVVPVNARTMHHGQQTSTDDEMRAGYKHERDALHEEAEMPLEQLMALYGYVVPGTHTAVVLFSWWASLYALLYACWCIPSVVRWHVWPCTPRKHVIHGQGRGTW